MRLYFDFVSPYAYLAFKAAVPVARARGYELTLCPVLFAGLLSKWGQLGPAEVPPKRVFMFKDVLRRAADLQVPLKGPATHPFNPLLALRVSLAEVSGADQEAVVAALFDHGWGQGGDIETAEGVTTALTTAGLNAPSLVAQAQAQDAKSTLKAATSDAVARGVFGVPTFIVQDELFFGQDRWSDVQRYLDGRDPIDPVFVEEFLARPSSADRRRS